MPAGHANRSGAAISAGCAVAAGPGAAVDASGRQPVAIAQTSIAARRIATELRTFSGGARSPESDGPLFGSLDDVLKRFEVRAGGGRASRGGCWEYYC